MLAQTSQKEELERLASDTEYFQKLKNETTELLKGNIPESLKESVSVIKADGSRETWEL